MTEQEAWHQFFIAALTGTATFVSECRNPGTMAQSVVENAKRIADEALKIYVRKPASE